MTDLQAIELLTLRLEDALEWADQDVGLGEFVQHTYRRPSGVVDLFSAVIDPSYPAPWCHVGYVTPAGRLVRVGTPEFQPEGDYYNVATQIQVQLDN